MTRRSTWRAARARSRSTWTTLSSSITSAASGKSWEPRLCCVHLVFDRIKMCWWVMRQQISVSLFILIDILIAHTCRCLSPRSWPQCGDSIGGGGGDISSSPLIVLLFKSSSTSSNVCMCACLRLCVCRWLPIAVQAVGTRSDNRSVCVCASSSVAPSGSTTTTSMSPWCVTSNCSLHYICLSSLSQHFLLCLCRASPFIALCFPSSRWAIPSRHHIIIFVCLVIHIVSRGI